MLFDLTSPGRKTAVRIIFGFLALIFAGGFIFLGIGSEGGFNPFDNAGSGSTDDALEQQIEDAEAEVDASPDDPDPLASLIVLRAGSGDRQLDEETQAPIALTEDSRQEYEEAILLWQQYLELEPRKVNAAAAGAIVQSYQFLGDVEGAIEAQRELVASDPTGPNYVALAYILYTDLQIPAADKARDKALAESDADNKETLTTQFEQLRKQAIKAEEEQKKQPDPATGESPELSDPFGGLSTGDPATQAP